MIIIISSSSIIIVIITIFVIISVIRQVLPRGPANAVRSWRSVRALRGPLPASADPLPELSEEARRARRASATSTDVPLIKGNAL